MKKGVRFLVSDGAAASVDAGHPWVFSESHAAPEAGSVVSLHTRSGRCCGWGLADRGPIAVRVLGRTAPLELRQVVSERIVRADRVRTRLIPPETNAYRVLAGPGDGLPGLVVDRYGDLAVLRIYAAAWEPHLEWVVPVIAGLGWVRTVLRRFGVTRVDGRDGGEVLAGPEVAESLVVQENGMAMLVRPLQGQKTGLFLDQRAHRALVRRWSAGRTTVNLFAYTGGFSVAAALGGAAHVTTVDIAPDAVDDARENFVLNGLDPAEHAFEVADAFAFEPQGRPDLLVVDPPSLARGKRSAGAARSAYRKLHKRLGRFVPRDGLLATSSCTARLNHADWARAVSEGLQRDGDWSWHWSSSEPPDHPVSVGHLEGPYLKFALLRRR